MPASRNSWKRAAVLAGPCFLASLALLPLTGCENPTDKADKKLSEQVDTDQGKLKAADLSSRKAVIAALSTTANMANISPASKADAKMRLAQQEMAAGDMLAQQAVSREISATQLAGEIRGLQAQIQQNNVLIDAYQKTKPDAALQSIEEHKAGVVKGDASGAWVPPSEKGSAIPAQTPVTTEADKLTASLKELTAKKQSLEQHRAEATNKAEELDEQARKAKGQQALDLSNQAAEQRKQAREATRESELNALAISHAEHDLKIAQARQQVQGDAIKALDERGARTNDAWAKVQEQIKSIAAQSERLVGKPGVGDDAPDAATPAAAAPAAAPAGDASPTTAPTTQPTVTKQYTEADIEKFTSRNTITYKAEHMTQLVEEAERLRSEALKDYDDARTHIKEASALADQVRKTAESQIANQKYAEAPEQVAWKALADVFSPSQFNLQLAATQEKIARAQADKADALTVREELRTALEPVLKTANLPVPETIGKWFPSGDAAAARAAAEAAFGDAEALLQGVIEDAGKSQKYKSMEEAGRVAKVSIANVKYHHAKFLARMGDAQKAGTLMSEATTALREVQTDRQTRNEADPSAPLFADELLDAAGIKRKVDLAALGGGATTAPTTAPTTPDAGAPTTAPTTPGDAATTAPTTAPTTPDTAAPPPPTPATPPAPADGTSTPPAATPPPPADGGAAPATPPPAPTPPPPAS